MEERAEIEAKVGKPGGYNQRIDLDVEKARAMHSARWSPAQIAAFFGVSVSTVKRRLRDAVSPGGRSEPR